jgi:hypothetical protein
MQEVPYRATHPLMGSGRYNPISLGDATSCPTRSYWWLALAAAVGAAAGWQVSKSQKKGRRR